MDTPISTDTIHTNTTNKDGEPRHQMDMKGPIMRQLHDLTLDHGPQNFANKSQDISALILKSMDDFEGVARLILKCVLQKAMDAPNFCALYAKLCYSLFQDLEKGNHAKESENTGKVFLDTLLDKCYKGFKNTRKAVRNVNSIGSRRRFIGMMTMIGELHNYGLILWKHIAIILFEELQPQKYAEDIRAICELLKVAGRTMDRHGRQDIDWMINTLQDCASHFDFKTQCMVREICEMRNGNYQHRTVQQEAPKRHNNGYRGQHNGQRNGHRNGQWKNGRGYNKNNNGYRGNNRNYSSPMEKPVYRDRFNQKGGRGRGGLNGKSVEFKKHVTLPPRTRVPQNVRRTKTWSLKNNHNKPWGNDVKLVYLKATRTCWRTIYTIFTPRPMLGPEKRWRFQS